jgi:hypothetical protein
MPTVERLTDAPIIFPHMDSRMGDNIGTPSLIRVPDWVENRLGRYYLYFSHHKGRYIRMAHADRPTGPWVMHEPGVLDIADSLFPAEDPPEPPEHLRPAWAAKMKGGYLYAHIASPDVHVRQADRTIAMYFHGLLPNGDQSTRLAVSRDGLSFEVLPPLLGPPYFRVAAHRTGFYTTAWGGVLLRADDWEGPFETGPRLVHFDAKEGIGEGYRHGETFIVGDTMHLFYHRMGDCPERILHATVAMTGDWRTWRASEAATLMEPELEWEGADLPLEVSTMGTETARVRQLRDPCVFVDEDGETYLLYCGAGESGIGIGRLRGLG